MTGHGEAHDPESHKGHPFLARHLLLPISNSRSSERTERFFEAHSWKTSRCRRSIHPCCPSGREMRNQPFAGGVGYRLGIRCKQMFHRQSPSKGGNICCSSSLLNFFKHWRVFNIFSTHPHRRRTGSVSRRGCFETSRRLRPGFPLPQPDPEMANDIA